MPIAAAAIPTLIVKSHAVSHVTLESHCSILTPAKNAFEQLATATTNCAHHIASALHTGINQITSSATTGAHKIAQTSQNGFNPSL